MAGCLSPSSEERLSPGGLLRFVGGCRWVSAGLAVVALVCAGSVPVAFAGSVLPCMGRETSAAFSRWSDPAPYFLVANGGFEHGADDWSLSPDAAVVVGNAPFLVGGPTDTHSLRLAAGATAQSRPACVRVGEPTVRLFVKTPRVASAVLVIDATVRDPTTGASFKTRYLVVGGVTPAGWAPTPPIKIPTPRGRIAPEELTLRFRAQGAPAAWAVDDIYIDPFKSF